MVVLNDKAKLLASPTTIYLIDKGILTLNNGIKKLDVSTFKASSIVESMLFNPPTTDSYKIGSLNLNGSNIDIYGKDTSDTYSGDADIEEAFNDLAEAIYPSE